MDQTYPLAVYKKQKGSKKGTFFLKRGVKKALNKAGRAVYGDEQNQKRFVMK